MECCLLTLLWYGVWAVGGLVAVRYLWELRSVGGLSAKAVLITGCDSGFGQMLALRLAGEGMRVFAACLTTQGQEELKRKAVGLNGRLTTLSLDVTHQPSVDKAFQLVQEDLDGKGLWGLVNNAGIVGQTGFDDFTIVDDYQKVLDVNTLGVIRTTQAFKPLVKKSRGRVVTVASVLGRVGQAGTGPYTVSKHAVQGYLETLRQEMYNFGVKVVTLEPGYFQTKLTDAALTNAMFTRMWDRASPQTRAEYGQQYYNSVIESIPKMLATYASPRTDYVIDAYHHALTALYPRDRYHVGWDSICFYIPISICPSWFNDLVFRQISDHFHMPKPAAAIY